MTFCRRLPVTLLSDDVGLGKTISAGLVASELMARGRVSKILVVCPKLLMPQWAEELKTKFNIESVEVVGQGLRRSMPPNNIGAVITTYHSAKVHLDSLGKSGFEMLILDEAHKLRNLYGVTKTPQVALRFKKALKNRLFKYVLMLTATPIQNRLWDIYSLVDLLTVARGHENPFGTQGMFARKFIADARTEARQLKPEKKDEFRSIVYGYMSRTCRGDVSLFFPERQVLLHKVDSTLEEIEILDLIKEPIQKLNRLVQISILQALVSSPHALASQLENSARNGTIPKGLAVDVRTIVNRMKTSAKLEGLAVLVDKLKSEQGKCWRVVIFTERRETQTTIEAFLGERGIVCGLINGDSGLRNQETIEKFKKDPPDIHAIVSTRAGSEGVNLQVANVLVNYDLPWNPMIVEQRIGRVQRLASKHANVSIFNIILKNTFEEYIVGRLMEKLQMASHAIGDIESLLEVSGMDDEENSCGFEEKIRELVVASLAGKDVQESTRLAEESISQAKLILEREEQNINAMLGGNEGAIDLGPRCPKLPLVSRSISAQDFALKALESLGAKITLKTIDIYSVQLDGRNETIRFRNEKDSNGNNTLCRPGTPFFDNLVSRISMMSLHFVEDVDENITQYAKKQAEEWVGLFDGIYTLLKINGVQRCFSGIAMLNVRITNTHDCYERLLEIECSSQGDFENKPNFIEPIGKVLEDPMSLGLSVEYLKNKAMEDNGVSEFCRFYLERLEEEIKSAGESLEKKKKLADDFTPHVDISLVGLEGKLCRKLRAHVQYQIESTDYDSIITLFPYESSIIEKPEMKKCEHSGKVVPVTCLSKCEISGKMVLSHILCSSEVTGRQALLEHTLVCALTGKRVLSDEVEKSDVTGKNVSINVLKTSALSGKKAEPEFFEKCEFTFTEILKIELRNSQVSGKKYRMDEETHSAVSGKSGHRLEFIFCSETDKLLLPEEAE
ncbi:DEAD/DEAH box helicase, partial [bacterium]